MVKKAFALKATYGPLGTSVDQHFYVVSSFIDEDAPPLCAHGCPTGSSCEAATGRCQCGGTTPVNSFSTVDCSLVDDCSCETRDSVMSCLALTSSCPAGQKPNPSDYSTCIDCDLGKFATAGATECSFCTPGQRRARSARWTPSRTLAAPRSARPAALSRLVLQRVRSVTSVSGPTAQRALHASNTMSKRPLWSTSVWDCVCKENSYRDIGHSEANSSFGSCLVCQKDLQGNWSGLGATMSPESWQASGRPRRTTPRVFNFLLSQ